MTIAPRAAGWAHIMGVEVVQAAGDVQGDALALVVPRQVAGRVVLDGVRQVAALHQLQHLQMPKRKFGDGRK